MPRQLKLYIIGVVAAGALALGATTLAIPVDPRIGYGFAFLGPNSTAAGLVFWTLVTLVASALPVRMPRGTMVGVSVAPILAATVLGGPTAGAWVAFIGSTEIRELRGHVPWYGSLTNHAGLVLPSTAAGLTAFAVAGSPSLTPTILDLVAGIMAAAAFFAVNASLTAKLVSLRTDQSFTNVLLGDARGFAA